MTSLFSARQLDGIVAELKIEEGFRSHGYRDSEGNLSLGYGRCIEPGVGLGLTEDEALDLLENDVYRSVKECRRWHWFDTLKPVHQSVLVQLSFQLGLPSLSGFIKMLAALEKGDMHMAAAELLDSKFARQVPARAERLAQKLRS